MSNLCMPHFAGWAKVNGSAKTQYKDDGRFKLRPNSFHQVPGQRLLPFSQVFRTDTFDIHSYWETAKGLAGAWCSSAINVGSIQGHSPSASITSYKVIPAILTSHNWPGGVPGMNEWSYGGGECCGGGAERLDLTQTCCVENGDVLYADGKCPCDDDYISECANGYVAIVPKGYQSACVYDEPDQECPPIKCNPCEEGTERGPSDILKTTYWSSEFENYLKDFMGINQPDVGSHTCRRPIRGTTSMSAVTRSQILQNMK